MKQKSPILFWFRNDLRLTDNPGLYYAAKQESVLAVYIHDTHVKNRMGQASSWWLHHSLNSLNKQLNNCLNFYHGNTEKVLLQLLKKYSIDTIYWNNCYEPWHIEQDEHIKKTLQKKSIKYESFDASLLWEPTEIIKKDKTFYKIFTPFYKNGCMQASPPRNPLKKPTNPHFFKDNTYSVPLEHLTLLPQDKRFTSMQKYWSIGESAAQKKLAMFCNKKINSYKKNRDFPALHGTSGLSPHLHFGEISPHQIWKKIHLIKQTNSITQFVKELCWREFSYYLLYYFPQLPEKNFKQKFDHFMWEKNIHLLHAWQQGKTGYPIVDAGMRELWQTGYMHNRVRMIVGSFLIKNLLIHWHNGQEWFWDCLVDADLANNSANWQWVAGSGADAAPFFRIFNPIIQGKKYDPEGIYIRQFVPELSKLTNKYLFNPWTAPEAILKDAHIILGKTYPFPIVDLKASRNKALKLFLSLKNYKKS